MATGIQGLLDCGNDADGVQGIHEAHVRDAEYLAGQMGLSSGHPDAELLAEQGAELLVIDQIKDKNVKEAMIAGSHHPPAAKVGVGVCVWCGGASGQFSRRTPMNVNATAPAIADGSWP